jgi:hypothetical protein
MTVILYGIDCILALPLHNVYRTVYILLFVLFLGLRVAQQVLNHDVLRTLPLEVRRTALEAVV